MPLSTGTRLGSYEVLSPLGAGGMGEVYLARDTKLGRSVAVKVVREGLAADPDRVVRFEREAKVLASLNHPHIAALYGMEQADGRHFLVMELVEGETLADRLRRGAMPVEETLKVALQIADALEAAHEKSIVHRDLKPANVKITPDEKVKVLDFGLAKAMETERAVGSMSDSPTLSMMATQAGIILGTAAYMSPEQAKGFPADHRSDVFSFGVVLYEMLTGRQPFQGETAPDVLASVLVRDPEMSKLPADLNPRLPDLVRRCLEKSPKRRWQAIGDLRSEIEAVAATPRLLPAAGRFEQRPLWRRAIPVALAAVASAALAGVAGWWLRTPAPQPLARFSFAVPAGLVLTGIGRHSVAFSPNGQLMAFVADSRIYLRSLSELHAKPISGTENFQSVTTPAFSPDGQSLAFYAQSDQTLKRIAVTGGAAVTICSAANPYGMNWGTEGLVFGQGRGGVMRVSANAGKPEQIVTVKDGELAHGPQILPGGQHVLFTLAAGTSGDRWEKGRIVVQSLATQERKPVIEGGSDGRYLPTGHLVFALSGSLYAVGFDVQRLEVKGGSVPVVEGVRRGPAGTTGAAHFGVSSTGSLVYFSGPALVSSAQLEVVLADRKGATEKLKLPPGSYSTPRVSPDGKQIAFVTNDGKEDIISVYDLSGGSAMRRLTYGGNNRFPVWSSDGKRIAFQSDREGDVAVFSQPADNTGTVERLTKPEQGVTHAPESWHPTANVLLFASNKGSEVTLWSLTLPDEKATPFGGVKSSFPTGAVFAPNGQWVAYSSTETGSNRVYVQPFPTTGARYQVYARDPDSGHHVLWSQDGKELFYNPRPGAYEVVTVTTQPTFSFGNPAAVPRPFTTGPPQLRRPFDMTPSGKFVALAAPGQDVLAGTSSTQEIHVVLNWFEELKQRAPVK
ncbi:MAG TPA: protein kinase [Vicinamibacterales bacterium]|nr:protein kinase [Vicinamibacterales bacterium]